MLIKVTLDNDVRRVEVDGNPPTYKDLRITVRKLFATSPNLPERFVLKYMDDENDAISLTSDKELTEALHFLVAAKPRSFLRLSVHPAPPKATTLTPAAPTSGKSEAVNEGVVHEGVVCDGCNEGIKGIRYKCGMCANFDFCAACEGVVAHDQSHVFVKLRAPNNRYGFQHRPILRDPHPWMRRGGGCRWSDRSVRFADAPPATSTDASPGAPAEASWEAHCKAWADSCKQSPAGALHHAPPPGFGRGPAGMHAGGARRCGWDGFRRGGPHCQRNNNNSTDDSETLSARFVADVTIPDGSSIVGGTQFDKVWRMVNDGANAWPAATVLANVRGHPLGVEDSVALQKEVAPGEEIDITVPMRAPTTVSGRVVSVWRLVAPAGFRFGHRIWADINIVSAEAGGSATATTASTADVKEPVAAAATATEEPVVESPEKSDEPEREAPAAAELPTPQAQPATIPTSTPTPTPEAPVPAPQPVDPQAAALEVLSAMGFKDIGANRRALANRKGDIVRAVHDLLRS
eukprot:TRINITY_DN124_c0_g1_i2.p1 TRINITY_DN124_c0_g1~~TRINITY_DN124_c0_g1_i2.p1  ORF type:complete len:519 (+),score=83.74 TRINITY_DN124_c0_g1_i2:196-1752(+)